MGFKLVLIAGAGVGWGFYEWLDSIARAAGAW